MLVDLLLALLGVIVFIYDAATFPVYWLLQQPWRKRWVKGCAVTCTVPAPADRCVAWGPPRHVVPQPVLSRFSQWHH
jgi:hypothetical protein